MINNNTMTAIEKRINNGETEFIIGSYKYRVINNQVHQFTKGGTLLGCVAQKLDNSNWWIRCNG